MGLINVQQCRTSDEVVPILVPSHSEPGVSYTVIIRGDDPDDAICECEGFNFRGKCSHQQEALRLKCNWTELVGPETQNDRQRQELICPRCSGDTEWVMELVD